ncbi:MAG: histidinol dehydrogenase, partial [Rhodospirillales bacterium]
MPVELNSSDANFEQDFTRLLHAKRETDEDVRDTVSGILADIRKRGDAALFDYTKKFDRVELTPDAMRVSRDEINLAIASLTPDLLSALELARDRIIAYHERQRPADFEVTDDAGVRLGSRWTPVGAVGLYVPGGTASYPSSVLMNALPARVAGVPRIAMVVPAPDGALNPLVLAAARIAGVEEIYRIGGAQAVA